MTVPAEVTKIVESSGNSFHARVASWFKSNGWEVLVSPYYLDQMQSKAREIDLIVEKTWPVRDLFGREVGDVLVRLYVECKFIPGYSVIWFSDKDSEKAQRLVCRCSAFRPENRYTQEHHYLAHSAQVAKVFASGQGREGETDPIYKGLNQVLNAFVAMKGRAPVTQKLRERSGGRLIVLEYPVIVCNTFDRLFGTTFFSPDTPRQLSEAFLLELDYAYVDRNGGSQQDYFLVDFVQLSGLEALVNMLDIDAKNAAFLSGK